jgi:hypothetical protein
MQPTPFHRAVAGHLQVQEPDLWNWFVSTADADADAIRLDLLKTTYKLTEEHHPDLYASARAACAALDINPAVTLYQARGNEGANATAYALPGEAHIVFSGPLFDLLGADEMLAVLGHELAHYRLWQEDEGRYLTADRLLHRLAAEEASAGVWSWTALRYRQYTEIYADRGAYQVCGSILPCVASLVKVETGTRQIHAEAYIGQADEIFRAGDTVSHDVTHPQSFIRTRALKLHAEAPADVETAVERMLQGAPQLDRLDVLGQAQLHACTRRLLCALLAPAWMRSETLLALARRYFEDLRDEEFRAPAGPAAQAVTLPPQHRFEDYLGYVLLDFALADPQLQDAPAAACLEMATQLEIGEPFEKLLLREARMNKRALAKLKSEAAQIVAQAGKQSA